MASDSTDLDCSGYTVTDPHFGAPYIDLDEWRETPAPHRHVHGGFADCDTRFTLYFPPAEQWEGRMIMPLEGAHAGSEEFFGSTLGDAMGGIGMTTRLGGYMVETNMGHIGDDIDPKGGEDATLYGWRAAAEGGRLSKFIAEQVYGSAPHHSYVWGGSGGGRRSPLVLENAPDVFDGALPFMGGGDVAPFPATEPITSPQGMIFACMFNVQRLLRHGDTMAKVIDAMQPGGSGNPYEGLTTHQREELATLYRLGFPRGDEFMAATPMGQIWLWTSWAEEMVAQDPTYFENFWTMPGYVGHDQPEAVEADLIDVVTTVKRVLSPADLLADPAFEAPEYLLLRTMTAIMAGPDAMDKPFVIEIEGLPEGGYTLGAGLKLVSGAAAGRQLYTMSVTGNFFVGDGHGDANLQRFSGVKAGDEIHVDNRKFLSFCYFYRHHLTPEPFFDSLRVDGVPVYPQHPVPRASCLMGVAYTGHYQGKLLWMHHTHDSSLWPSQGIVYEGAVLADQGEEGASDRFRLQWTENAEHVPPAYLPSSPVRASSTWLIDYFPVVEQGLVDLIDWVENGVEPPRTAYSYNDGKVTLPSSAAERGGIQPVVRVAANDSLRAEIKVGEPVRLELWAETPERGGSLVSAEWDFDGWGTFPFSHELDGSATSIHLEATHTYDAPGTYFATAKVHAHRDGDVTTPFRRLANLASARIVVTE